MSWLYCPGVAKNANTRYLRSFPLNFAFANHGKEDEIYPLTLIEIAEAQR
jgi:hypothetical protein